MDKDVDFLASDIPLVEKNWQPPDFNIFTILHLPLIKSIFLKKKKLSQLTVKQYFFL